MGEVRTLWHNLRVVFTLVPWRMRPKLIAILLGSIAVALMDMAAVMLLVPVMQIISGMRIGDSAVLQAIATFTGREDPAELLLVTLATVIALMIAKNLFTLLFRWWSLGIMAEAHSEAIQAVMDLYGTSAYLHQRRRSSEDIFQTVNVYVPTSVSGVVTGVIQILTDGVAILAILLALLILSPLATGIALVFFGGAAVLIQALLKPRIIRYGELIREANLRSWRYLSPAVDGYKEVRLVEAGAELARSYADTRREVNRHGRAATILGELPRYLLEIIMILGILVIALALFATSDQQEALTFLGVFGVASVRIMPALVRVLGTVSAVRSNSPNLQGLVDEVQSLRAETGREDQDEAAHAFGPNDILFEDVTFQFPDATDPVLDGVSGRIPFGKTVALVGGSGAGKTTFVELLMALLAPDMGAITVGGASIHDHPVSWRRQLGVVAQDVYLLDQSVRENIAFGVPTELIDEDRVNRAVALAQLSDFVAEMPQGLDTVIGYRGARVSGGQRQRIGIARALYRDPQVLILDEATSALDNETEARITRTIEGLHGSITIVVVAHRLSTVKNADAIMFFSRGKITDVGTMSELVRRNPEFAELVRLGKLA